jgi:hypothetical protein
MIAVTDEEDNPAAMKWTVKTTEATVTMEEDGRMATMTETAEAGLVIMKVTQKLLKEAGKIATTEEAVRMTTEDPVPEETMTEMAEVGMAIMKDTRKLQKEVGKTEEMEEVVRITTADPIPEETMTETAEVGTAIMKDTQKLQKEAGKTAETEEVVRMMMMEDHIRTEMMAAEMAEAGLAIQKVIQKHPKEDGKTGMTAEEDVRVITTVAAITEDDRTLEAADGLVIPGDILRLQKKVGVTANKIYKKRDQQTLISFFLLHCLIENIGDVILQC